MIGRYLIFLVAVGLGGCGPSRQTKDDLVVTNLKARRYVEAAMSTTRSDSSSQAELREEYRIDSLRLRNAVRGNAEITRALLEQDEIVQPWLGQWTALEAFLREVRIAIDNNRVQNAIRPTAIGKKNWLFIGEAEADHRGAILYTLDESFRRRGIDPQAYLRDVLTRCRS